MYQAKEHVTLDTLLGKLKERVATRQSGWKWSRSTLYKFITSKMNFIHKDRKIHYEALHEDVTIAEQRIKFIKQIKDIEIKGGQYTFKMRLGSIKI